VPKVNQFTRFRKIRRKDVCDNLDEFILTLNKESKIFFASRVGSRITISIRILKRLFSFNFKLKFAAAVTAKSLDIVNKDEIFFKISVMHYVYIYLFASILLISLVMFHCLSTGEYAGLLIVLFALSVSFLILNWQLNYMLNSFISFWDSEEILGE